MAYTNIDKPSKYFNTVLYTGNGSTRSITGVGFQPDWVWIKERSASASAHNLSDAVRGAGKALFSNTTDAEYDYGTGTGGNLRSFDSDGFSLGTATQTNDNGTTFVSWNWDANGAGVSNTAGTITSTVSANTTSGFSIVSYTGNGTGGATVGHGLGAVPKMIIVKYRNSSSYEWCIQHTSIGNTGALFFNTASTSTSSTYWNNTSPTSSVFTLGSSAALNNNTGTFIAYCFAEVKGFSKFGSYTGNASTDGVFVYTGFTPAWVLWKNTSTSGTNWVLMDNKRNTYNPENLSIAPNTSDAEADFSSFPNDFLSNGFKLRNTGAGVNASGSTYIYMAFASNPFVTSKGVPVCAR